MLSQTAFAVSAKRERNLQQEPLNIFIFLLISTHAPFVFVCLYFFALLSLSVSVFGYLIKEIMMLTLNNAYS